MKMTANSAAGLWRLELERGEDVRIYESSPDPQVPGATMVDRLYGPRVVILSVEPLPQSHDRNVAPRLRDIPL